MRVIDKETGRVEFALDDKSTVSQHGVESEKRYLYINPDTGAVSWRDYTCVYPEDVSIVDYGRKQLEYIDATTTLTKLVAKFSKEYFDTLEKGTEYNINTHLAWTLLTGFEEHPNFTAISTYGRKFTVMAYHRVVDGNTDGILCADIKQDGLYALVSYKSTYNTSDKWELVQSDLSCFGTDDNPEYNISNDVWWLHYFGWDLLTRIPPNTKNALGYTIANHWFVNGEVSTRANDTPINLVYGGGKSVIEAFRKALTSFPDKSLSTEVFPHGQHSFIKITCSALYAVHVYEASKQFSCGMYSISNLPSVDASDIEAMHTWCKSNAPEVIKELPMQEMLEYMRPLWERYVKERGSAV